MDKKIIIFLGSAIVLAIAIFLFSSRIFDNSETGEGIYKMTRGEIVELKPETSVIVEGEVGQKRKRVEFIVTPQTVFKNVATIFTKEELQSGETFVPKTELRQGEFSDLELNIAVYQVISKESLTNVDKATAIEIKYSTNEFPSL